jgi:hypothetical protein
MRVHQRRQILYRCRGVMQQVMLLFQQLSQRTLAHVPGFRA